MPACLNTLAIFFPNITIELTITLLLFLPSTGKMLLLQWAPEGAVNSWRKVKVFQCSLLQSQSGALKSAETKIASLLINADCVPALSWKWNSVVVFFVTLL